MKYRITNLTNSSLIVEDLSIRLPGKGDSVIVDSQSADRSSCLKDLNLNGHVRIEKLPRQENALRRLDSLPVSDHREPKPVSIDDLRDDVAEIKSMLTVVLSRIESLRDRQSTSPPAPLVIDNKWAKKANKR